MKGWIKVHTTEGVEIYMRASMIEYVYKREEWTVISLTKEDGHARVKESPDHVLALIEKAEGEEVSNGEAKRLSAKLQEIEAKCVENEDCYACKWFDEDKGMCPWKDCFGKCPNKWNVDKIPEEYR